MGSPYLSDALIFLISTAFGLYILAVMLRLMLQLTRADFYNPVSQFLVRVTNPPLRWLRRFIPGWAGIDWAAVALLLVLQMLEISVVYLLDRGGVPGAGALLILATAELIKLALYVFLVSILIQVVLSWVSPGTYNPVSSLLHSINEPLLGPARRLLPPVGGLDLSPILVLIALQLMVMLVVRPLTDFGMRLL